MIKTFAVSLMFIAGLAWVTQSQSKPVAIAKGDDANAVVLTDEDCKLDVKLPYRAIWSDGKQLYEGCYTVHGGIVVMFFEDKSLSVISSRAFQPLSSM